jgi:hypothetical protein
VGFRFGHFHFSEREKLQYPQLAKAHTKSTSRFLADALYKNQYEYTKNAVTSP